jgi:hypothetical protein
LESFHVCLRSGGADIKMPPRALLALAAYVGLTVRSSAATGH